jgi:hypothetical protein
VPTSVKHYSGRLADPEFRRQRARKAAHASHNIDAHIKAIVDRAPELSAEQRDRLALLLRAPVEVGT